VTFDGDTHPVGDVEFMSVEFAGSIVVPDAPEGASLDVPFSFSGVFSAALQSWVLSGAGTAAALANVEPRGWRNYGEPYVMTSTAEAGEQIRVWMYSPAIQGYVVIDDVTLTMRR